MSFVYVWLYRVTLLFITFSESQTSDIQIISCKPLNPYMCTSGDLVKLAGYGATTTSAGTRKARRMMSAEPLWIPGFAFGQAGRWLCGFWRHMFLWHTYHTALGIVSRLQRKLFTAVGSLRPCLANPTRFRQRQEQESPRNNCSTVLSRWDCGCIFKPWSRHNAAR